VQDGRAKHINVIYHFFSVEKRIEVKKIDTKKNFVDVFTKLVPKSKFMC